VVVRPARLDHIRAERSEVRCDLEAAGRDHPNEVGEVRRVNDSIMLALSAAKSRMT